MFHPAQHTLPSVVCVTRSSTHYPLSYVPPHIAHTTHCHMFHSQQNTLPNVICSTRHSTKTRQIMPWGISIIVYTFRTITKTLYCIIVRHMLHPTQNKIHSVICSTPHRTNHSLQYVTPHLEQTTPRHMFHPRQHNNAADHCLENQHNCIYNQNNYISYQLSRFDTYQAFPNVKG